MKISVLSFYILSAIILCTALLSVTSKKIFRSAVWLLASLTAIAGLYFWLDLQFLAAVQIVVYIGGIVVLIIFSIFLTEHTGADLASSSLSSKIVSGIVCASSLLFLCNILQRHRFNISSVNLDAGINSIGHSMLSSGKGGYVLPFEVISILLLAALVGCIANAIRLNLSRQ